MIVDRIVVIERPDQRKIAPVAAPAIAHDKIVQGHAMEAWRSEGDFRARVSADPEVRAALGEEEIARLFDLPRYLVHTDALFERVFGPGAS